MTSFRLLVLAIGILPNTLIAEESSQNPSAPEGWTTQSPREEIRPEFAFDPKGGPKGKGCFTIKADDREGLIGSWEKSLPIEGGHYYRFSSVRRTVGVKTPRRVAVARILWRGDKGQKVLHDEPADSSYRPGEKPQAEPEYPADGKELASGWTEVVGMFRAPSSATQAVIELWYQWEPNGVVEWADVSLQQTSAPAPATCAWRRCIINPVPARL